MLTDLFTAYVCLFSAATKRHHKQFFGDVSASSGEVCRGHKGWGCKNLGAGVAILFGCFHSDNICSALLCTRWSTHAHEQLKTKSSIIFGVEFESRRPLCAVAKMALAVFIATLLLCSTVLGQEACRGELATARDKKVGGAGHSPIRLDGEFYSNSNMGCQSCSSACEDRWGDSYCTGNALSTISQLAAYGFLISTRVK